MTASPASEGHATTSAAKLFESDFCLGVLGRAAGSDGLAPDAASEFKYKWVKGTPR